jgi:two-component system sporulation sensor kinase B
MSTIINDLQVFLLNIFFVFIFFYIYLKFIEGKISRLTNEVVITIVSGIFIIICMTFTAHINAGHMVELRQIPFFIGALYGGRRVAVYLFFILITYRFYLGGSGFYITLAINSSLLISLWYIIPLFKKRSNIKQKVYLTILACFFAILSKTVVISLFFSELLKFRSFTLTGIFLIVQSFGIILFVILIEKSKRDTILAKELRKLEKLKTVSEIAASISHEVRNPLTITKGFLQLLSEPDLTDQDKNEYIKIALEALDKAESTITDYLTFAKPSLENIKILDLHKELAYIRNFVDPYAAMNNVQIETRIEEEIYITGEDEKLHQCLINVVKNGIESMPQGGKLLIELRLIEGNAIISVTDTGIGMDEEQIERLGSPFFTTKDIGTGLGTMVVYSIVKAMGGEIYVDSEVGKGTTFTILLPVVEQSPSFNEEIIS